MPSTSIDWGWREGWHVSANIDVKILRLLASPTAGAAAEVTA